MIVTIILLINKENCAKVSYLCFCKFVELNHSQERFNNIKVKNKEQEKMHQCHCYCQY
ncbi:hypothetical protein BDF20DRAFT_854950 [Mycotypha africana]|uniref:uncharacterized protein n=1 Tax=Mycotypha africana TaxID=64632 RepID=UPI0023011F03|nr:uncharacterized protein BDF20DRAFT_854950 [Mycotypha africana]KAI8988291.1 hypothetical protein BDF20DRAFT_854950 [Mycotypha africana]